MPPIFFSKQLQRERDGASVKEARRIWVQGLEGDRAAAGVAAASAAAAIAATNATAAAAAATDDDAEKPSSAAPSVAVEGGVLSFLDPPTSEAEAFAAAAITERYRVLGQEADARAARARWKRQRSARVVAARSSLKMLYAEESQRWRGMATKNSTTAAASHGTPADEVVVDSSPHHVPAAIEATPAASPSSGPGDGDGGPNGRIAEEAFERGDGQAAGIGDAGGVEVEEAAAEETVVQEVGPVVPEHPEKHEHPEDAKFSPVTVVDEPGGKSVSVSAALGGPADETPTVRFSHVNIVQEPGGTSCGVSGALGADVGNGVSDGGDDAATASSLPGRSGLRRIVQEPGGSSIGVSRIMSHGARDAADRVSTVGTGAADSAGVDPVPRASIQGSGGDSMGLPRAQDEVTVAVAAAGVSTGNRGRGPNTLQNEPPSGGSRGCHGPTAAEGLVEAKESSEDVAPRGRGVSGKLRSGRSFLVASKEDGGVRGRETDAHIHTSLPLEVIVRRCVREPVLAQCSAVDSAALAFLVRDAGVAEHLASLRTFLLGLTSDFLHDFTLRLLDGLYDGG